MDPRDNYVRQGRWVFRKGEGSSTDSLLPTWRRILVRGVVGSGWSESQEDPGHDIAGVWSGGIHGRRNLARWVEVEWKDKRIIYFVHGLNTRQMQTPCLARWRFGTSKWRDKGYRPNDKRVLSECTIGT